MTTSVESLSDKDFDPNFGQSDIIRVRARGAIALFTNPAHRAERFSYPFPTHAALRGLLRCIYPHSPIDYRVERLIAQSPVKYDSILINEISHFGSEPFYAQDRREQRMSTFLVDVDYVIEFRIQIVMPPRDAKDNIAKYTERFHKFIRSGYGAQHPYFGLREYLADCELFEGDPTPCNDYFDNDRMYYDYPVYNRTHESSVGRQPIFRSYFHPMQMIKGVVKYPKWRDVLRRGEFIKEAF